jgi:hypothetical protein
MTIDALRIITLEAKSAGSHASDGSQNVKFLLSQLAVMVVIAVLFVGALAQQEVVVAKLQLLQAIQIVTRNALEVKSIHTLPVLIALHRLRGR